jgi:hypothetical protein
VISRTERPPRISDGDRIEVMGEVALFDAEFVEREVDVGAFGPFLRRPTILADRIRVVRSG